MTCYSNYFPELVKISTIATALYRKNIEHTTTFNNNANKMMKSISCEKIILNNGYYLNILYYY